MSGSERQAPVSIHLLGPLAVEVGGAPLVVDTRKALALLAYLAATRREVPRDRLAALLWSESAEPAARGALRRTLSVLNAALAGHGIVIGRSTVSLREDELDVDLWRFRAALEEVRGHAHDDEGTCRVCRARLEEAVALDRGDFLAGFAIRESEDFEDWQLAEAEVHRRELAGALERLTRLASAQAEWNSAIGAARRWLELDPLHEAAHRALMLALARSGEQAAAVAEYRSCVRILDAELGVAPLAETTALFERISAGELGLVEAAVDVPSRSPSAAVGASAVASPPALPLLGRDDELDRLEAAWTAAGSGCLLVVVSGEAGIGKTRLLEAFLERVVLGGGRVLGVRCHDGEQGVAYGAIAAAIRAGIGLPGGRERLGLLPSVGRLETARLVSEVADASPPMADAGRPAPGSDPGARLRFLDGVAAAIAALAAGPTPGVLALDDVQWADDASLELLGVLVHRPLDAPLVIVATVRAEELGERESWARVRRSAGREGRLVDIDLDRLPREAMAEIVRRIRPGAEARFVARMVDESEGLPLVLAEALAVVHGGSDAGDGPPVVPGGMRAVLGSRLRGLGETERQLLATAAVLGAPASPELIRVMSGRSEEEVVDALEALVRRRLVVEADDGSVDVAHGRIRQLVLESMTLARRRLLHRRAAEAIANRSADALLDQAVVERLDGARAAVIAHHLHAAGRDTQAAFAFARAGDHARSVFANAEALSDYDAAIAAGHPDQQRLQEAIGDLHTLAGRYEEALAAYDAALALARPTDVETVVRIEHAVGLVHARRGEWGTAERHLALAAAQSDGMDAAARGRLLVDRGLVAHRRGVPAEAARLAREALAAAESADDREAVARAHNLLGLLAAAAGEPDRATAHLERSLVASAVLNDPSARVAALNNLARVRAESRDYAGAIGLVDDALTACVTQGDRHREAALRNLRADLLHAAGSRDDALEELKRAVAIFAAIGASAPPSPGIWLLESW